MQESGKILEGKITHELFRCWNGPVRANWPQDSREDKVGAFIQELASSAGEIWYRSSTLSEAVPCLITETRLLAYGNSLQYPCMEYPMDRGAW